MFTQAGLRFDQDFLNRVFFSGRGGTFQFFSSMGNSSGVTGFENRAGYQQFYTAYKPNLFEKLLLKIASGVGGFLLRLLFGRQYKPLPGHSLDYHTELEISQVEASAGGEKQVSYKKDGQSKTLIVKVPASVKPDTRIRLHKMGMTRGDKTGDFYLHIKIKN